MAGAFILLIIICANAQIQRMLQIKPLLFLGRISFSLYAVHWLFAVTCYSLIMGYCQDAGCGKYSYAATVFISIAASIGAAWVMTRHIDEPCIGFSKWFAGVIVNTEKTSAITAKQQQAVKTEEITQAVKPSPIPAP